MNFKRVMTVYRKEMLEMFRDKRTILSTIVLPFVLYPILFVGVSSLMIRQTAKLEKQGATIVVADSVKDKGSQIIMKRLNGIENFEYLPVSPALQNMYRDKVLSASETLCKAPGFLFILSLSSWINPLTAVNLSMIRWAKH
jgi:sodium transport system permease protein